MQVFSFPWCKRGRTYERRCSVDEILQTKYPDLTADLFDFDFGPNKIQIQSTIFKELLQIEKEDTEQTFEELCRSFSDVCLEYDITFNPVDLFILVDDELKQGTSTKFRNAHSGSLFAEISIPAKDFTMHEFWKYSFLHELGHSWFSIDFSPEDIEYGHDDLFIDLVVICAFRKILPPDKRVYKEVRKHRPYFLTQQSKRFIGKGLYKQILRDPEGYLRDLQQKIHAAHR
jgi:hypothetical protein